MFARMATFEIPPDTSRERGEQIAAEVRRRIDDEQNGPAGAQRVLILVDRAGNRAHNVTFFDTKENMEAAEAFFEAMTPVSADEGGRRTDVGHFEVLLDHEVAAG